MVETRKSKRNFAILFLIISLMWLATGVLNLNDGKTSSTIISFLNFFILFLAFLFRIKEPFVQIRKEDIVINRNLFHSETIKWRDIQELNFSSPFTAELLLSGGRKIDVIMSGIFMPKRRKKEIESLFQNIKNHFESAKNIQEF